MINNNKKFLRKAFKEKRSKINLSQYQYLCKCIYNNLIKLEIWDKDFFHIYLSNDSKKEVSTNDIMSLLMKKNKKVIVPKICHDQLIHFEIDLNTEFIINELGIREPIIDVEFDKSLIEVIIVPLLVFDRKGHRVGYGGGYYDRFMSNAPKNVVKIGLSLFEPIDEISDINQNDIELNFVVTPSKTYSLHKDGDSSTNLNIRLHIPLKTNDQCFLAFFDNKEYELIETPLPQDDPLKFQDNKKYTDRLK